MRLVAVALGLAAVLAAPPAHADDLATRLTVQLAEEGGVLFKMGKFAEALDRYERADVLIPRHTIGVRIARCLARLGRLVEAAERYDAVIRTELPTDLRPDKLARQREARAQAEVERDALAARIPGVIVQVSGATDAVVTLDGRPVAAAQLGSRLAANPGRHHIEARSDTEVVSRDVTLEERQVVDVSLELHPPPPAPVVAPAPAPPAPPAPPVAPPRAPPGSRSARTTAGFILLGAGGASLVAGIVTGGLVIAGKRSLSDPSKCGNDFNNCAPSAQAEVDTYNTERSLTSGFLVIGGAISAVGIILVTTVPAPSDEKAIAVVLHPGGLGLRGVF